MNFYSGGHLRVINLSHGQILGGDVTDGSVTVDSLKTFLGGIMFDTNAPKGLLTRLQLF
jgi:hypothetical protein